MIAPPPTRGVADAYARFLADLRRMLAVAGVAPAGAGRGFCVLADVSARIRRVQDFVEVNLGDPLRLHDLAEVAGLSPYHFSRVFREETGETPWAFVRRARVERAKELLREGRTPAEAAVEAGFFDQSHLSRVFRALDGRTPGAFRDAPDDAGQEAAPERKDVQDA